MCMAKPSWKKVVVGRVSFKYIYVHTDTRADIMYMCIIKMYIWLI